MEDLHKVSKLPFSENDKEDICPQLIRVHGSSFILILFYFYFYLQFHTGKLRSQWFCAEKRGDTANYGRRSI